MASNALEQISVTMLTKNAQAHLHRSLEALAPFGEVILLDNGSSDQTLSIARTFANVTIITHPFIGFGPLKNLAAHHAKNHWILSIDSDEILTPALRDAIGQIDVTQPHRLYRINRHNHYRNKPIRCCGWYPDWVMRLYNKTHTHFHDSMVHESLIIHHNTQLIDLDEGPLLHYPYDSVEALLEKLQRYSSLYAQRTDKKATPAKAFGHAMFAFMKHFFLQRGFLCGYEGLLISVTNANHAFYKYMKLYEKTDQKEA